MTNDFNSDSMLLVFQRNAKFSFHFARNVSWPLCSTRCACSTANRHFSTFYTVILPTVGFVVFSSCFRNGCGYDNDPSCALFAFPFKAFLSFAVTIISLKLQFIRDTLSRNFPAWKIQTLFRTSPTNRLL